MGLHFQPNIWISFRLVDTGHKTSSRHSGLLSCELADCGLQFYRQFKTLLALAWSENADGEDFSKGRKASVLLLQQLMHLYARYGCAVEKVVGAKPAILSSLRASSTIDWVPR